MDQKFPLFEFFASAIAVSLPHEANKATKEEHKARPLCIDSCLWLIFIAFNSLVKDFKQIALGTKQRCALEISELWSRKK